MAKIDYKNKFLIFKVNPAYDYDISFDRLRKHEDKWLEHLSGKRWFGYAEKVAFNNAIKRLKENDYGKKII